MSKQTAIEWLIEQLKYKFSISFDFDTEELDDFNITIEQAIQIEKQQTLSAQMDMFHFINNLECGLEYLDKRDKAEEFAEQYYKQTYGGDK